MLLKIATQDISKCISECIEKILCNVIFHTENEPYFLTHQCESLIDFLEEYTLWLIVFITLFTPFLEEAVFLKRYRNLERNK